MALKRCQLMSLYYQPGKITVTIMKSENPRLEVPDKWVIYHVGWPCASVTHTGARKTNILSGENYGRQEEGNG